MHDGPDVNTHIYATRLAGSTALALAAFVGCSSSPGHGGPTSPVDGTTPATTVVSLTVAPPDQTLVIDGTAAATSSYTATATFADGHSGDVTAFAKFSIADPALGSFLSNGFTSTTDHGGGTSVIATVATSTGQTGLTLQLKQRYPDPGSMGLPADPGAQLGGADTPALAAQLVYPNDGVLVPPNLGKLEIHWKPAAGTSLFALAFSNATTDVQVYVGCTNPTNGGCIYVPDAKVWHWLAESNRGGAPLALTVRASDGNGGGVGKSNAVSVSFSHDDINGGLYYWTTSNGTGIMRFDFASPTQTTAQQFIGTSLTGGVCVGCHALSRDGRKLVAEAGGQNDGRVLLLDVAKVTAMVPFASTPKSIFESWAPDGGRYVGVYGDNGATDYNLQLFDGNSGVLLGNIAGTGTQQNPADHPDWSLDGKSITYVKVGQAGTMQRMWSGAIELLTSPDGMMWSAPTELVASSPSKNHYYPSFSPDGSFIIYDESTCPAGSTTDAGCNADTDATATLWAVKAQAGAAPIALTKCNAGGLADGMKTALTNSFPRWSPFVFKGNGELNSRVEWVTFSSTRNYGLRPPPPSASPNGESIVGTLIWMAAIDPDKILAGEDGCYAAFALPFQDVATSNHIAQWTTQVVPPIQ
jgi:WD40 repeat protein